MNKNFYVYDPRTAWVEPSIRTAKARGWRAQEIQSANDIGGPGYVMLNVDAVPEVLKFGQVQAEIVSATRDLCLITDLTQIRVYENKRGQTERWSNWMPNTFVSQDFQQTMGYLAGIDYPVVSKADVGASSTNVRILKSRAEAEKHVREIFGNGVRVNHCAGHRKGLQKGYVILQEFIPHTITYRVNIVGRQRAIFERFCYPDRNVAQTGNVLPVHELNSRFDHLLHWVGEFANEARTNWCAIDALYEDASKSWLLLETSLRWPWPSPGNCDEVGRFFLDGFPTRPWKEMWHVMFDEIEAGAFGQ